MDIVNNYIASIKKDLNLISYKIDNTIPNGYGSILYILIIIFIVFLSLYNNPFWSYVLLLLFIFTFLSIYTNKDFTNINLMKTFLNLTLKPICLFYLIIEKSFTPLLKDFSAKNIILFAGLIFVFFTIIMIIYVILNNQIKCKYDLNKIKQYNETNFNNDNLSTTGENECKKLNLNKCYSLEELQPCLNQIKNTINPDTNEIESNSCNYCIDYSYHDTDCSEIIDQDECNLHQNECEWYSDTDNPNNSKCIDKSCGNKHKDGDTINVDACKKDNRCKYDEVNDQCLDKEENTSRRLCLEEDEEMNYKDDTSKCNAIMDKDDCEKNLECSLQDGKCVSYTSIKCQGKQYCANKLDTKYCHQMPDFSTYNSVYIIIYFISSIVIYFLYNKKCISDKSFILIILMVNILCLILFMFLQNTGIDKYDVTKKSVDSAEFS